MFFLKLKSFFFFLSFFFIGVGRLHAYSKHPNIKKWYFKKKKKGGGTEAEYKHNWILSLAHWVKSVVLFWFGLFCFNIFFLFSAGFSVFFFFFRFCFVLFLFFCFLNIGILKACLFTYVNSARLTCTDQESSLFSAFLHR